MSPPRSAEADELSGTPGERWARRWLQVGHEVEPADGGFQGSRSEPVDGAARGSTARGPAGGRRARGRRRGPSLAGRAVREVAGQRLAEARRYFAAGRVTDVRFEPGRLTGRVQGQRPAPYLVEVAVPVFAEADWRWIAGVLGERAAHRAWLVAGGGPGVPDSLDAQLSAARLEPVPSESEVSVQCGCEDSARFCAHVLALWQAAAARVADDVSALLQLRGRGRQQLLADLTAVREQRSAQPAEAGSAGTKERWTGEGPAGVAVDTLAPRSLSRERGALGDVVLPAAERPATPAPRLRLRGDPPGWAGTVGVWELLHPLVSQAADHAEALDREP